MEPAARPLSAAPLRCRHSRGEGAAQAPIPRTPQARCSPDSPARGDRYPARRPEGHRPDVRCSAAGTQLTALVVRSARERGTAVRGVLHRSRAALQRSRQLPQRLRRRARPLDRGGERYVPDAFPLRAVWPQPDVQPALRHRAHRAADRRARGFGRELRARERPWHRRGLRPLRLTGARVGAQHRARSLRSTRALDAHGAQRHAVRFLLATPGGGVCRDVPAPHGLNEACSSNGIRPRPSPRVIFPASRYGTSVLGAWVRSLISAPARFAVTLVSNSASPCAGTTKLAAYAPLATFWPAISTVYSRPVTGRSRSFGLCSCRRTLRCCTQTSALTTWIPTIDTLGGSSFGAVAHAASSAVSAPKRPTEAVRRMALPARAVADRCHTTFTRARRPG